MSVGVVAVAVGDEYQGYVVEWAEAVAALNRHADAVRVVVDTISPALERDISAVLPIAQIVRSTHKWDVHPQVLANDGIATMYTDWICKLDIDDLILPHAFDPIDETTADVLAFGISINGERDYKPNGLSTSKVRDSPNNLLYAGSPFRRWVWERSSGFRDMVFDDWAFWREAAANGATFEPSGTVDYIYRLHGTNASLNCDDSLERQRVFEVTG